MTSFPQDIKNYKQTQTQRHTQTHQIHVLIQQIVDVGSGNRKLALELQ